MLGCVCRDYLKYFYSFVRNGIKILKELTTNILLWVVWTFNSIRSLKKEHGVTFYFCELISFINVLQFSTYRSFTSLVMFIPRYFLFDANCFVRLVARIVSFISLTVHYIETQQISIYWFCIQQITKFTYFGFLVESLGCSIYRIMSSAKSDCFLSFQFGCFYLFFLCYCCG